MNDPSTLPVGRARCGTGHVYETNGQPTVDLPAYFRDCHKENATLAKLARELGELK